MSLRLHYVQFTLGSLCGAVKAGFNLLSQASRLCKCFGHHTMIKFCICIWEFSDFFFVASMFVIELSEVKKFVHERCALTYDS